MTATDRSVRKTVVVKVPIDHAFQVFTARFDAWWPRTHHIGKSEPYTAILEPREGGRWYERGADGTECDWGRVLVYSPPRRVVVSWHLTASYSYDPDPAKASRVEVTFHDDGNGTTRVELSPRSPRPRDQLPGVPPFGSGVAVWPLTSESIHARNESRSMSFCKLPWISSSPDVPLL